MTDPLQAVRTTTAARVDAQSAWVAALREAVESGMTLAQVAAEAGITRARVSQIVGPTGRKPGRRVKAQAPEAVMQARLDTLDKRWESFVDKLADRFAPAEADRRAEQAYRNIENGRARRQASGLTRGGKLSGASGRKSIVRPTVTVETRRFAETFALRYLEENPAHPVCVKVIGELDEAALLREQLTALRDTRVAFLHD